MEKDELDLAGAAITGMEKGDLPDVVDEGKLEAFRQKMPPEILDEKILSQNQAKAKALASEMSELDDILADAAPSAPEVPEEEVVPEIPAGLGEVDLPPLDEEPPPAFDMEETPAPPEEKIPAPSSGLEDLMLSSEDMGFVAEKTEKKEEPRVRQAPKIQEESKATKKEKRGSEEDQAVRNILSGLFTEQKGAFDDLLGDVEEITPVKTAAKAKTPPPPVEEENSLPDVSEEVPQVPEEENIPDISALEGTDAPEPASEVPDLGLSNGDDLSIPEMPAETALEDVPQEEAVGLDDLSLGEESPAADELTEAPEETTALEPEAPGLEEMPDLGGEAAQSENAEEGLSDLDIAGLTGEAPKPLPAQPPKPKAPPRETAKAPEPESLAVEEAEEEQAEEVEAPMPTLRPAAEKKETFIPPPSPPPLFDDEEDLEDIDETTREAYAYLKTFKEENKRIIYEAITGGLLNDEEVRNLVLDLSAAKPEEAIIRELYEHFVRLNKLEPLSEKSGDGAPLLKTNIWPILRLVLAGGAALALLIWLFTWTSHYTRAYRLYSKGLTAIDERQYQASEEFFTEAFGMVPSVKKCNEYAAKYIEKGRYYDAEKKYELALTLEPKDYTTLFNFAKMYVIKEDFATAERRLREMVTNTFRGKIEVREELGNMFIDWGRVDASKFVEGDKVFNTLLLRKEKYPLYLAKKMEIASLQRNYTNARRWFEELKKEDKSYLLPEAHGEYLTLLLNRYEERYVYSPIQEEERKVPAGYTDDRLYLVKVLEDVGEKIYQEDKSYLPNYYTLSRWKYITRDEKQAERIIQKGISLYEKKGAGKHFHAAELYEMGGIIKEKRGAVNDAIRLFTTSLEMNEDSPLANFHMGRISVEHLGNISNANDYFNRAKLHWNKGEGKDYAELLHGLAYTFYFKDKLARENAEKPGTPGRENLLRSLAYWNELRGQIGRNYAVEYGLGDVYLHLGENDLALGQLQAAVDNSSKHLEMLYDTSRALSRDLRKRIEILSDLYNNLGVAEMGMVLKNREPAYYRRSAINHFINAIDLKERLSLPRGIPTANFQLLKQGKNPDFRDLQIADENLPKRLDFRAEEK